MSFNGFKEQRISPFDKMSRRKVKNFLANQGLDFDEEVQYTIALFDEDRMIATGSMDEAVLKCIAIDENYQGLALTNQIISGLINEQHNRGFNHLFVYTKPENKRIFTDLGFYNIMEVENEVSLLENKADGIDSFTKKISQHKKAGTTIAALVMNCNPFTKGHRYVIEHTANENDIVHVFVVEEDRSDFPFADRLSLVRQGTADLENVIVHPGGTYIISAATFPSYFLKDSGRVTWAHAALDLRIFGHYIAPALGITTRYVGEEPHCQVTATYNRLMSEILPEYGITKKEIPRLEVNGKPISASYVRKLLAEGDFEKIKELVPTTTYEYLIKRH